MKKRIVQALLLIPIAGYVLSSHPPIMGVELVDNNVVEITDLHLNAGVSAAMNDLFKEPIELEVDEGYTTTKVNLRRLPSTNSDIVDVIDFNQKVLYSKEFNNDWCYVEVNGEYGYIYSKYISKESVDYIKYTVPSYSGKKTYMPYSVRGRSIFHKRSKQYLLQQSAYTGTYGIRQVNNRYCVALGSAFTTDIGQYFDLVLKNGEVIPCILSDAKSDKHTDSNNIFTVHSNCCSEFIVDTSCLISEAKRDGDISSCTDKWDSPVVEIIVYNKNFFD